MTPVPSTKHQKVVLRTGMRLEEACPDGFDVLPAPFAVQPSKDTELQPDVLVARLEDLTDKITDLGC